MASRNPPPFRSQCRRTGWSQCHRFRIVSGERPVMSWMVSIGRFSDRALRGTPGAACAHAVKLPSVSLTIALPSWDSGSFLKCDCPERRPNRQTAEIDRKALSRYSAPFFQRRRGREVEGTPLLREHAGKTCIEGSNPSVSASINDPATQGFDFPESRAVKGLPGLTGNRYWLHRGILFFRGDAI